MREHEALVHRAALVLVTIATASALAQQSPGPSYRPYNQPVLTAEREAPDGSSFWPDAQQEPDAADSSTLLAPGEWLVSTLLFWKDKPAASGYGWWWALFISLWVWLTAARLLWAFIGRAAGFYDIALYRYWLVLTAPLRTVYLAVWLSVRDWIEGSQDGRGATARWAGFIERSSMPYNPERHMLLGRNRVCGLPGFMPLGHKAERHQLMFGMTGAGKTAHIMTELAHHRGSSIVVDPAGQIARAINARCGGGAPGVIGKGFRSLALDPYRQAPNIPSASWNPFIEIERAVARDGKGRAVSLARTIAECLITKEEGENKPFFPNTAKGLVHGLVLWVYLLPEQDRNLVHLRDLLMNGDRRPNNRNFSPWEYLLWQMSTHTGDYAEVINAQANAMLEGGRESGRDVIATARSQLAWLDYPELHAVLKRRDFSFEDLKLGLVHLAVCAPVSDLTDKLAAWFRLITALALYVFETTPGKPRHDCLLVVDELPSLGLIPTIEKAPAHIRKFGIRFIGMAQDIGGLRQVYDNAEGMIGNADAVHWFPTDNEENISALSEKLGTRTRQEGAGRLSWLPSWLRPSRTEDHQTTERPLMYPHQIKRFLRPGRGNVIVTIPGRRPQKLKATVYHKDLPVWLYQDDRDHPEKPFVKGFICLRGITRAIARALIPGPVARPEPGAEVNEPGLIAQPESAQASGSLPLEGPAVPLLQTPFREAFERSFGANGSFPDAEIRAKVYDRFRECLALDAVDEQLQEGFDICFDPEEPEAAGMTIDQIRWVRQHFAAELARASLPKAS